MFPEYVAAGQLCAQYLVGGLQYTERAQVACQSHFLRGFSGAVECSPPDVFLFAHRIGSRLVMFCPGDVSVRYLMCRCLLGSNWQISLSAVN